MPISDTTRKLLWSRAHNACAICRAPLTSPADSSDRPGLVLGEEAHIVARREKGPRGRDGDRATVDEYQNLILLCPIDHKRVDDQPDVYTAADLRARKAAHEEWATKQFEREHQQPIRIVRDPGEDAIAMEPVVTGTAVWDLVAGAGMFSMRSIQEDDRPRASDAADEFLTFARDTGMIADAIQDDGFSAVRDSQRTLQEMLLGLWEYDLFVYGRRVSRRLTGGGGRPIPFAMAHLVVLTADELRERGGFSKDA